MSHDDEASAAEGFTVLHSHTRMAADGAPALTERFLSYLDARPPRSHRVTLPAGGLMGGLMGGPMGGPMGGLTLAEGRRRLSDEHPDLAACLERCCVGPRRQTTRAAAATLGLSAATVCNRKRLGVAQLVIWCGVRQDILEAALECVDKPLALRKQA